MTRIFYSTWVKPACCVSKISSDGGCQSKETGVGMEVRLSSVGARGFFLAASRLSFAASPLNVLSPPTRKKPLAPRVTCIWLTFSQFFCDTFSDTIFSARLTNLRPAENLLLLLSPAAANHNIYSILFATFLDEAFIYLGRTI